MRRSSQRRGRPALAVNPRELLAWWEGGDNHNMDGWESEDACNRFAQERLGPAMAQAGVQAQPTITFHPAHEVYAPQARTVTA